jgi:hypothetical protein
MPTTTTIPICIDTQPPSVQLLPYDSYIQNIGGYQTLFDSHEGDIRFCINVTDDCGIINVEFGYKLDCDPWNYWVNYTSQNNSVYCFNLTKSQWTKYLDDTINWGYKVTDVSGKTSINYDVNYDSPIIVRDDDTEPPSFSQWQYKTIVSFNKSISINVTITDYSNVSSASLYYDYNSDGLPEGVTGPVVDGGRYYYQIPAPCESNDKEFCVEQGRARVYMQFWIIAEDSDSDRDNDASSIRFNSMPIFIDPPGEDYPDVEDAFYIAAYSPSDSKIEVLEGRMILFYAYTNYPKDADLTYRWVLDGREVSQNKYQYSYQTDHSSAGEHTMIVYISNGKDTLTHTWKISVVDKPCDFELRQAEVKTTPRPGSSVSSKSYSTTTKTTTATTKTTTTKPTTTQKIQVQQESTTTTVKPQAEKITGRFVLSRTVVALLLSSVVVLILLLAWLTILNDPRKREEAYLYE